MIPTWSTACPDWETRIVENRSLIPFDPLFPAEAAAAMDIFKGLKLIDLPGHPTIGDVCRPWLFNFAEALFGAYDASTGRRLIQYFFLLVGKKNTKSTGAAGIMATACLRNWRDSGEFLILSPTREIADNSFRPAHDMVAADPELRTILKSNPNQRLITHLNTGATLKVVAADSEVVGGKKTIGLFVDELWLFGKKANAATMLREAQGGLTSRPEGFVIYASTQSDTPPTGIFAEKLEEFRAIRDGKVIDNKSLGVLYEYPQSYLKSKRYLDPTTFYIPNPNLGASVDEEYLVDQFEKAQRGGPANLADFLAKHLNVEIRGSLRANGWAGAIIWERGAEPALTLESLIERSEVLVISMDGGGLDDLFGLAVLGREKETGRWLNWNKAFLSPIAMERRKANLTVYEQFMGDGDLVLVDEMPDDLAAIIDIVELCDVSGKLHSVGLDPAVTGMVVDELAAIGITTEDGRLVGVKQGVAQMGAIKTLERKLADGSFRHAAQRIMAWCSGNVIVEPTSTGIRIARDESGFGKIDPFAATVNCVVMMSMNPGSNRLIYEERGLRVA